MSYSRDNRFVRDYPIIAARTARKIRAKNGKKLRAVAGQNK
jgi:hypothetical protein